MCKCGKSKSNQCATCTIENPVIPGSIPGNNGWSPLFAVVVDNVNLDVNGDARYILQLVGWFGGTGTTPTSYIGQYLGSTGFVPLIINGQNIRGAKGNTISDASNLTVTGLTPNCITLPVVQNVKNLFQTLIDSFCNMSMLTNTDRFNAILMSDIKYNNATDAANLLNVATYAPTSATPPLLVADNDDQSPDFYDPTNIWYSSTFIVPTTYSHTSIRLLIENLRVSGSSVSGSFDQIILLRNRGGVLANLAGQAVVVPITTSIEYVMPYMAFDLSVSANLQAGDKLFFALYSSTGTVTPFTIKSGLKISLIILS